MQADLFDRQCAGALPVAYELMQFGRCPFEQGDVADRLVRDIQALADGGKCHAVNVVQLCNGSGQIKRRRRFAVVAEIRLPATSCSARSPARYWIARRTRRLRTPPRSRRRRRSCRMGQALALDRGRVSSRPNTFAPVFHVKIEASDTEMANKFLAQVSPQLTRMMFGAHARLPARSAVLASANDSS